MGNTFSGSRLSLHNDIFVILLIFCHQYFGCLPLKISSICLHSILKMISASRRIFFVFLLICCHQYFGCLPLKISSVCLHSILKMISATRRIFFVFYCFFCHQYFDCLPPKIWSYRNVIFSPGILSMRSIFLQGFQGLKRFILMSF